MPKAPTSRIKAAQGGVAALPLQGLHTREHVVSTLGSIRNEHGFLPLSLSLSLSLPSSLSLGEISPSRAYCRPTPHADPPTIKGAVSPPDISRYGTEGLGI
jgi:hypothetical protein